MGGPGLPPWQSVPECPLQNSGQNNPTKENTNKSSNMEEMTSKRENN